MLNDIKTLAHAMTAADSQLRVITVESYVQPRDFLTLNDEILGEAFQYYTNEDDLTDTVVDPKEAVKALLKDMVKPMKDVAPGAYRVGLSFMEDQKDVFGDAADKWTTRIHQLQAACP